MSLRLFLMTVRLAALAATLMAPTVIGQIVLSGTYNGQTLNDSVIVNASTTATFTGGTTFTGPTATLGNSSQLQWQQSGTLSGKTITFGTSATLYIAGTNSSLTLDPTTTASGDLRMYSDSSAGTTLHNQGTLTHTAATSGQLYARNLTNSGSITVSSNSLQVGTVAAGYTTTNSAAGTMTATGSGTILYLDGTVDNNGTLTATSSGQLRFRGTNTTANLGNIVLSGGGRALLAGTLDNTAATLTSPSGGPFELFGGRVSQGTIAGGALTFTTSGGTLDNTILTGNVSVPASAFAYINNSTAFSGGNVTFGTSSYFYLSGTNATLTLDPTTTASGDLRMYSDSSAGTTLHNQGTLTHTATTSGTLYAANLTNSGSITVSSNSLQVGSTSAGYTTTNSAAGTMTATGSGTILYLDGTVDNNGTLTATSSGQLRFRGTNTTANLGNIVLSGGGRALLSGTLDIDAAALTPPTGGPFELFGGTVFGGIIGSGALSFTTSGGYLKDTILSGDVIVPASAYAYINNTSSFTAANLTFGNSSYFYLSGTNATLTLDDATTASGDLRMYSDGSAGTTLLNQGTLTHTAATSGLLYARNLTNSGNIAVSSNSLQVGTTSSGYTVTNTGTMTATGSGSILYLDGTVDNNGTLAAANSGQLRFRGTNTTANLGNIVLSGGGRVLLDGTLDNSAATLTTPSGGPLELFGGRVSGGTVASGALSFTTSGGYLDNTSLTGNVTFPGSAYAYLNNSTTVAGGNLSFGGSSFLYLSGANATLTLDATTTGAGDLRIYSDGSNGTTLNNQGSLTHTVSNSGLLSARNLTNSGNLTATAGNLQIGSTSAGYATTNTGTITSSGSGVIVYLDGALQNTGTLAAANSGQLRFRGSNSSDRLGQVNLSSGGRALLTGTLDNQGRTLSAPTGGAFELFGGTLTGGTLASGSLTFTTSGGTLADVSFAGLFAMSGGSYSYFNGTNLLFGANLSQAGSSFLSLSGVNTSLTIDSDSAVTGQVRIYSDGAAGSTLTNSGLIHHTSTSSGEAHATAFTNLGTITASAGTLALGSSSAGYSFTNQEGSLVRVTGSASINLRSPVGEDIANFGTIDVQSGTLLTNNRLINQPGSALRGAGTISGSFTLAGGTLAPGNSVGTLTVTGGNLFVTEPSIFAAEIDGGAADLLLFQFPTDTIDLGSGLLTLSLTLLSPPTAPSYDLIRIGSGGSGITGTFAGLPGTGATFTSNYEGTPYVFAINYQTNAVSLHVAAIPEPSTYALLGLGAATLAYLRRRRR